MSLEKGNLFIPSMRPITAEKLIPVIGYVRVSTWREEKVSDKIQMDAIKDAAARRGRYVAEWVTDLDMTGRNFKRRIMEAIALVEADDNPLREIWVWKFSRFGRNRYGVAINLARIEQVGGQLLSATEDIDASTAVGEFTRDMLFAVAAFESNRAGEQWRETHALRRSLGLPASGGKRFGYQWHPRRLPDGEGGWKMQDEWYEVLDKQAEVVNEAYSLYTKGTTGFSRIAQRWQDLGFVNSWGNPWQDQGVRDFLDGGFAAGLLYVHKEDVPCADKSHCHKRKRDHWTYIPAEHESIIGGDVWDNYRDRREVRKNTPRRSLVPKYPLSGLVECGICRDMGRKSHAGIAPSGGVAGVAYRCGLRVRKAVQHEHVWVHRADAERAVFEWLQEVRDEIDAIAAGRVVTPLPRLEPDVKQKRKSIEDQIAKLTGALDRATKGHVLGDIPRDSYLRTKDELTRDRDELQTQLDALPAPEEPSQGPVPFRETVRGLLAEWDTISVDKKRLMLSELIRRVEVRRGEPTIVIVPTWAPADKPVTDLRRSARARTQVRE
ncbi:recombinase family protein [Streptomyces sp. NPDC006172]|uniref:recombinase family protein n=1 Tax=Streptomyces sp. NPDC006172 TaxID=3154470 RepID=UPI0033FE4578